MRFSAFSWASRLAACVLVLPHLILPHLGLAQTAEQARQVVHFYAKQDAFSGNVVVFRDGKILINESYGLANAERRLPLTAATRFAIASVTKQFTAASILVLQEQGLLHTNDKLSRYYPEAPAAWKDVTLRQLLQHTSGIPDSVRVFGTSGTDRSQQTPQEVVKSVASLPMLFPPGSHTAYNNTAYLVLGLVIERVSGVDYAEFLRSHLFKPLGMLNTGLGSTAGVIENRAVGYRHIAGGAQKAGPVPYTVLFSAGGLYSTGEDLSRWLIGLHGGRVLKPASYAEMMEADADGFGYGTEVSTQFGQRDTGKDGLLPGFIANTEYFPVTRTGIIVLSNQTAGKSSPGTHAICSDLMQLSGDEHAMVRSLGGERKIEAKVVQAYAGVYRSSENAGDATLRIDLSDGHLRLTPKDKNTSTLMAQSDTRFYMKEWDGAAEFHRDEHGVLSLDVFNLGNETRSTWHRLP